MRPGATCPLSNAIAMSDAAFAQVARELRALITLCDRANAALAATITKLKGTRR